MREGKPKPPANTGWIKMERRRDVPGVGAIYGVALLGVALIVILAAALI